MTVARSNIGGLHLIITLLANNCISLCLIGVRINDGEIIFLHRNAICNVNIRYHSTVYIAEQAKPA